MKDTQPNSKVVRSGPQTLNFAFLAWNGQWDPPFNLHILNLLTRRETFVPAETSYIEATKNRPALRASHAMAFDDIWLNMINLIRANLVSHYASAGISFQTRTGFRKPKF